MTTFDLAQEIGYSSNQFVSLAERKCNYEGFERKAKMYLMKADSGLKPGFELLPMEEDDGIDVVAFMMAKKIKKLNPTAAFLDVDYLCFTVQNEEGKSFVRPPLWFVRLLFHATEYRCSTHGSSLTEFFISRVTNYLGIHDDNYNWKFDGKTNEEKVIDMLKEKVGPEDMVEYTPGWFVSIIHKGTEHHPGLDGACDYMIELPRGISEDKLVSLLSREFGEATGNDQILFCYTWKIA